MRRQFVHRLGATVSLFALLSSAVAQKRGFTLDDLFRLETVDSVAISPDGALVAYDVQRPLSAASSFDKQRMWGKDRSDVWVSSLDVETANITGGASDASGFWKPVWSPDGEWLAMFSSRGGDVRIWVWQRSSGQLRMLSDSAVNPWSDSVAWVSGCRLVYAALASDQKSPALAQDALARESPGQEWKKQAKGVESTASVLESGVPFSRRDRPLEELRLTDVATGETHVLSRGIEFVDVRISPDCSRLAVLEQTSLWQPMSAEPVIQLDNQIYDALVVDLKQPWTARSMIGVKNVFAGSLEWSPQGKQLALIGDSEASPIKSQVFRCSVITAACEGAFEGRLRLNLFARNRVSTPPYFWCKPHTLIIYAISSADTASGTPVWWTADSGDHVRNFSVRLGNEQARPTDLVPDPGRDDVIGLLNGSLWRLSKDGVPIHELVDGSSTRITSIDHLAFTNFSTSPKLILQSITGGHTEYSVLDLRSEHMYSLAKPAADADLATFDGERTFVFSENDSTGTYLWATRAGKHSQVLVKRNQFLSELESGRATQIDYRSTDGVALKGWVVLPPAYKAGQRLPVIVWVYAGLTYGDQQPFLSSTNNCHPLNLQLLAGHGYAVLFPSMPLKAYGESDEPYLELSKGVMPAIEKLVDQGIADPDRVGVMGQSYGGYSVYGLITQYKLFKAAAALAGPADLFSMYGEFDPTQRYLTSAHEDSFRMWNAETSFMGVPPWYDQQKYIRNSPISYADRVTTPLLIIQGDLDYIPLQQGEEFFTALYRMNKRAEFVRYWGEGHLLNSPANIRDMWQRLWAWFDEFVMTDSAR